MFGGEKVRFFHLKYTVLTVKHGVSSIVLWDCFAASGSGAYPNSSGKPKIISQKIEFSVQLSVQSSRFSHIFRKTYNKFRF